jgi:hypothetical protein
MKHMDISILCKNSAMAMPEQQLRNPGSNLQTEEIQAVKQFIKPAAERNTVTSNAYQKSSSTRNHW